MSYIFINNKKEIEQIKNCKKIDFDFNIKLKNGKTYYYQLLNKKLETKKYFLVEKDDKYCKVFEYNNKHKLIDGYLYKVA